MSELEKSILEYGKSDAVRLHMPGHKGRKPCGILPDELYAYDITELSFSDELFEANDGIAQAEKRLSSLFGSGATVMSPFGATSCIQTMVSLAASRGKILLPRNMHYSVFNAIGILGAEEIILPVEESEKTPAGILSLEAVEEAFKTDSSISALFVTSVDYYGCIADIDGYARLCKKYCKLLLVDNSHGAHFKFLSDFKHPLELEADMVCDSIHKTVPAMTGSALLHFASPLLETEGKKHMKRICSSSPSYPIMLSICAVADWLSEKAEQEYATLCERLSRLKYELKEYGYSVSDGDPCRLYVCGGNIGISGSELSEILAENGCIPEFADRNGVLLMFTPMNSAEDIARVSQALMSVPVKNIHLSNLPYCDIIPQRALSVSEAVRARCECVDATESIGRIAAECIGRYPPGLPQIISGEYIEALPQGVNVKNILVVAE